MARQPGRTPTKEQNENEDKKDAGESSDEEEK